MHALFDGHADDKPCKLKRKREFQIILFAGGIHCKRLHIRGLVSLEFPVLK